MEEKKINKSIVFSIVAVLLLVIVVAGSTYAYFRAAGETDVQEITTAKIQMAFDDTTDIINAKLQPITTDQVLTKAAKKTFRIAKTSDSEDLYVKIKLSDLTIPEALAKYDLKWALYQGTTPVTTGDFGGKTSGEIVIATNQLINSTTAVEYNLYIWINETNLDQGTMMGQTMTAKITATGVSTKENTLASVLLGENNAKVTTGKYNFATNFTCNDYETEINGAVGECTSNYTAGLYAESGDVTKTEMGFPTYYYRGSVTNNYVKFGTYTSDVTYTHKYYSESETKTYKAGDPIIWRVVRINEDGSVKLVNESLISNELNYDNVNYKQSSVYNYINTWYASNIGNNSSLDSKVVKSSFCNDISGNYTAANTRLKAHNPQFICSSGASLDYNKVGMLTGDEVVYTGTSRDYVIKTNHSYLNDSVGFGTLTPGTNNSLIHFSVRGVSERLVRAALPSEDGIRAVINLSPDVIVNGGDGLSAETAYVIQ